MNDIDSRLATLEVQYRRLRIAWVVTLAVLTCAALFPTALAQQSTQPLRVRGLIVEDAAEQARVVLGAPMGEGSGARTGLRINDANGVERLGMVLMNNGNIVLGLDAPVGKGDDRNRERINLVADAEGGAYIVFKDRRTAVVARQYLDDQNRVWMEFADYTADPTIRRRLGLSGEETIRGAR
jgi:hypothetical protein